MKVISVPLSESAMHRLDIDRSMPGDLEEIELNDEQYKLLWETGLFDELNNKVGVMIDDFEDESILGVNNLYLALKIVNSYMAEGDNDSVFNKIKYLLQIAIKKNTGIFFYF